MGKFNNRSRKHLLRELSGLTLDQLLWYIVICLGLPYFTIHVFVAII